VDGLLLRQVAGNETIGGVRGRIFLVLSTAMERTEEAYKQLHEGSPTRMT